MAYDLSVDQGVYNASGKYGKSLSAGYGNGTDTFLGLTDYTLELWLKTTTTSGTHVAVGSGGCAWIGTLEGGVLRCSYGNNSGKDIVGPVVTDGLWHHVALTVSATTGGTLYLDGVSVGTNGVADAPVAKQLGVRWFGGVGGFDWVGEVDELAVSSFVKYTGNFTPVPVANDQPNLRAVYHFEDNGINSAGLAAPSDTVAPTATSAAVANGSPTIVAITMSEAMNAATVPAASAFTVGGHTVSSVAISGTVINLTCATAFVNGESARTVAYVQPGTNQARDVAGNLLANFSGLAITNNVAAAGDTTPPAFVSAQVTNSQPAVILVTMNETLAASVPPNSAFTASGGRTITDVTVSGAVASVTVNTPYASGDAIVIAYTQPGTNPRLQDATGNPTATFAAQSVTNNIAAAATNAIDTTKMIFSPGNWNLTASSARAVNAGAYFSTLFTGTSCKLQFDMTNAAVPPLCYYQIDNGPMTEFTVAANVVLNVPAATAQWADKGGHTLHFVIKQRNPAYEIYNNPVVMAALTGIVLDAGKTLLLPGNKRGIVGGIMGDSISEAQVTLDSTGNGDSTLGYAYALRNLLGAEIGVIGFGGQGWVVGAGTLPNFQTTYNKIYAGVARSFAGFDFIAINHGTNDGSNDVTAAVTAVLNGLLADPTLPAACKIIIMRPFNGSHAAQLQAGVAACSMPARVSYMDTTNFFNGANSWDNLHPYGNESSTHIAPQVAAAIKAILTGAAVPPTLTNRTVTVTVKDTNGIVPNLTNLKVSFYDEASPDLATTPRYQSGVKTTDANGVLTFTFGSTLASGGIGHLTVLGAAGVHFNGAVSVV